MSMKIGVGWVEVGDGMELWVGWIEDNICNLVNLVGGFDGGCNSKFEGYMYKCVKVFYWFLG